MKQILIVDDSAVIRKTLRAMFEQNGWYVCGEASDGQEGVAKAQALRPDVIVLDLSMPGMNGLTALTFLRMSFPAAA